MSYSVSQIFLLGVGYLMGLFACAWVVEQPWCSSRLARHPATYSLGLGVYASAWAIYGALGMADQYGYGFLTYYLGIAGVFVIAPVLLIPLVRLTRRYQLASLPDLLAFRFRSRWVGMLATLGLLLGVMPLMALQIQAVGDAIFLLTNESSPYNLAFAFCVVITLFAILFGARHISLQQRHDSLMVAIALESIVKLVAMLLLGGAALYQVFGGLGGLETWLAQHGDAFKTSVDPLAAGQWRTLLLLFFAAAITMPHIFHAIFAENPSEESLHQASWSLPLFLLLMALPVPIIYWAGKALGSPLPPAYYGLALGDGWSLVAFIAGLAAASGTLIVLTLALAPMILNHLVLAVYQPPARLDLYRWLLWMRRLLIATLILAGYLVYRVMSVRHNLSTLGFSAFIATLQFLPGVLALLFWQGANRKGLLVGLGTGLSVWAVGLGLPLMMEINHLPWPGGDILLTGVDQWYPITVISMTANMVMLIMVSLITPTSDEEKAGASACATDALLRPQRRQLRARSSSEMIQYLSLPLGPETAEQEVHQALEALGIDPDDQRPYTMRRLRDRIQANLSGLMGPAIAQNIVDQHLPYQQGHSSSGDDIHYMERHLEDGQAQLTGLARELDGLRRHHRQTLEQLPVGICTLGQDQEVLMWNQQMVKLSQISSSTVVGSRLAEIPAPWGETLLEFVQSDVQQRYRQPLHHGGRPYWLSLHKAELPGNSTLLGGTILLIEDQTEVQQLENELIHSERLASIGRLAAGVAHEIGNPVTGISSLAQNLRYDADEPEQVREASAHILDLTQRISRIVQSLMHFAHAGRPCDRERFSSVNLKTCAEEAIHLISLSPEGRERHYTLTCPDPLWVQGDSQRLTQVLVNILSNARDATQSDGHIHCQGHYQGQRVILEIHDDGCGLPEGQQGQLFEPFFTTKEPGQGTGLGLALAYSIMEAHDGQLTAQSPSDYFSGHSRIDEHRVARHGVGKDHVNDDSTTGHTTDHTSSGHHQATPDNRFQPSIQTHSDTSSHLDGQSQVGTCIRMSWPAFLPLSETEQPS